MTPVYRAPMRSRRDDVDPAAAVERALAHGVCGMGEALDPRAGRRLERLASAPLEAFVWTRTPDGETYVGRLTGPLRDDVGGAEVDLVHVRDTDWIREPVDPVLVPAGVAQTFARGGRNFQRIHTEGVEPQTAALWERLTS
jgi:hypothetical protein